jgi:dTDP-4-amino-4,6-dideoxygalactose transaminase
LHVGRPVLVDRDVFLRRAAEVLDRRWLTNDGEMVRELERRIAARLGVRHCVCTCNGTAALEIAARALELSGEVILPSWTFVATANALLWQGLTPVFADIDPETHNLDPEAVRRAITPRTSAILGVHLWGRPAPVAELQALAKEQGVSLFFDAAHAFGNFLDGTSIGNFGACEIFSFHATKIFSTLEGGAIVTNDEVLAGRARLIRNFGFDGLDHTAVLGVNGKMNEICAAFGLTSLERFDDLIAVYRANYLAYADALSGVPWLRLLPMDAESGACPYIVLEIAGDAPVRRDVLLARLHSRNVLARKYFWPGVHALEPYRTLFPDAAARLPRTCALAEKVLVLPTGTDVSCAAIRKIAAILTTTNFE